MNDRITQALTKLFERHRIVFWYDVKNELRLDFESLQIFGIEKICIANNEFAVKHRILRAEPDQKFLIFREGPQPDDIDNWLLDVQLAYGVFRTDQVGIWLSELELGFEFADLVQMHLEFFQATKRKDTLKRMLKADDTHGLIRLKMVAVCAACEPRMDNVVEELFAELAAGRDEKIKLIGRCKLDNFLNEQMLRCYGYKSELPGIRDFVIELFKSCYAMATSGQVRLSADALVFLKRWKDSRQFEESFEKLSGECAENLSIESDLDKRDLSILIELDYFRLIDPKIISELVKGVTLRTLSSGDVALWVRQRRQSHWYREYHHLYEAIDYAAQFIRTIDEANLEMDSLADGIQRYCNVWFRIDQLYRKFIYHVRMSGQTTLLSSLIDQIENLYSNNYLLRVNNRWQNHVDGTDKWDIPPIPLQKRFFDRWVQPFLNKDNKVYVIISDALRYEIGDELIGLIRQEDRYEANLKPALAMLPSYTQLGMAALLPNKDLEIVDNETGTILVDGQSSQGTINRNKILSLGMQKSSTCIKADELMALNKEDSRALVRDNDVVFVYHNRIDSIGDKKESEERVFEAVEETLQDILKLIKKLTAANASNLLVVSDHGFIYQNRAIEESDYTTADADGDLILYRDRRFVLGKGLKVISGLRKFTSAELSLSGDVEVQIPKSINRLRLKGSGSRFVHGGASLQEVVIPVIQINKKRQSDLALVEVDILRGSSSIITAGQLAVILYQAQPVTDKMQPRCLRAGIYSIEGELISDCHNLTLDLIAENSRERELQVRFVLTRKADDVNGQEVVLRLDEKLAGTTHFKEYKSVRYQMRRSFTSDFDF
jgi:uncharacterized protein (TIGR02687 family)